MDTEQIMTLALELAGLDSVPADSQIYHPGCNLQRILIGIDIDSAELWMAKQLGFDLALAHHPKGSRATLHFAEVLHRHVEQMTLAGVPREIAEPIIDAKMAEARIRAHMSNYDHVPSVARLIDMPFMNIHTPLDEIGRQRMAAVVAGVAPEAAVSGLIAALEESLPEFRNAETEIDIRVGRAANPIGKAVVSHGAGTNGGYPVAKAYFEHGIDTVIYIHCDATESARLRGEFEAQGKNLIVTGHIVSDSIGINPFIAELVSRGLEVQRMSGVIPG
jgi:hypothetical protein